MSTQFCEDCGKFHESNPSRYECQGVKTPFTPKQIEDLSELSHGEGNFQTILLKILADITKRLEMLEYKELVHHGRLK